VAQETYITIKKIGFQGVRISVDIGIATLSAVPHQYISNKLLLLKWNKYLFPAQSASKKYLSVFRNNDLVGVYTKATVFVVAEEKQLLVDNIRSDEFENK